MVKLTPFGRTSFATALGICFWAWFGVTFGNEFELLVLSVASLVFAVGGAVLNLLAWEACEKTETDETMTRHIAYALPVMVFVLMAVCAYAVGSRMIEFEPRRKKKKRDEFHSLEELVWISEE